MVPGRMDQYGHNEVEPKRLTLVEVKYILGQRKTFGGEE